MGAQKRKTAVFRLKLHFSGRKSATKFLCVKTVSDKVVRHSLAYLSVQKWLVGRPMQKFGRNWPTLPKRRFSIDFRS